MDSKNHSSWENDVNDLVKGIMASIDLTDIKKNINTTLKDLDVVIETQTNNVLNQTNNIKNQTNAIKNQLDHSARRVINRAEKQEIVPVSRKLPGNTASILAIIFGSIGTVTFTPLFLTLFILALTISGWDWALGISVGIFLPLLLISAGRLLHGIGVRGRISRFKGYLRLIRNRSFCKIRELADAMGKTEQFVIKDLKKMMNRRMFLEAHIDREQEYLILNHKTYDQYLLSEQQKQQRIEQESKETTPKSEIEQVIVKGRGYIRQMKAANEAIKGEEISQKLSRLELVTTKIFAYVEKNPEKLTEIRKFMDYYLPTTLKLINAYQEFDSHSFEGDTLVNAKAEIAQTLDTINIAFENLFDSLFEDAAMDISTDISVLQAVLAREGLTDSEFKAEMNKTLE